MIIQTFTKNSSKAFRCLLRLSMNNGRRTISCTSTFRSYKSSHRGRKYQNSSSYQNSFSGQQQRQQVEIATLADVPKKLQYVLLAYFGLVNVGAFGLFVYDKAKAVNHGWRVPEKNLQLSALIGGWIGGLTAMSTIRHKSKKRSFQIPYFLCTAVNAGLCIGLAAGWRFNPTFRRAVLKAIT